MFGRFVLELGGLLLSLPGLVVVTFGVLCARYERGRGTAAQRRPVTLRRSAVRR